MASATFPPDNPDLFWSDVFLSRDWQEMLAAEEELDSAALSVFKAVIEHDHGKVAKVLGNGVSPNLLLRKGGWSPLMVAIAYNDHQTVRTLVQHGAELDYISDQVVWTTPLDVAIRFGRFHTEKQPDFTLFSYLLDAGADMNLEFREKDIAIVAAVIGRLDQIDELLDRGYRRDLPRLRIALEARAYTPELEAKAELLIDRIDALLVE